MIESDRTHPKLINSAKILQIINALKRVDLSRIDIRYLKQQIDLLLKGYTHTSIILPLNWGKFHRAIKYAFRPSDKKELSYPPIDKAKLNRANFARNPVFYCSGNPKAVFFELGIKPGDTVVL